MILISTRLRCAVAALVLTAAQHAGAQSAPPPAQSSARWTPECGTLVCAVSIAMQGGPAGDLSGAVRFEWARYGGMAGLISVTVRGPLGIAAEPGMRMLIDGAEIGLPVKVCLPDGCAAAIKLDAAQSAALRAVRALEIRFIAFSDGRTISLTPDLDGLNAALATSG